MHQNNIILLLDNNALFLLGAIVLFQYWEGDQNTKMRFSKIEVRAETDSIMEISEGSIVG